ncbi:MAG: ribosome-associated translation inhibitor RaiA [Campylobacterota bacterium]|nr:ribosome-associated translation inhibitor RaiA [Campylobacterota bacterium]
MNTQIHAKDITLNDHTKSHIDSAIESFNKYSLELTSVVAHVKKEKLGVSVEFEINIAHQEPVIISQTDDSLDAAIDLAIERATKALRRLHDKIISHRGGSIKDLAPEDEKIEEEN